MRQREEGGRREGEEREGGREGWWCVCVFNKIYKNII